jgi:ATP-dependent DNA ligase
MHYVTWLGLWVKVKCLHRQEFVVVGWTDPEGRRPRLGALLLAYYDPDGRLAHSFAQSKPGKGDAVAVDECRVERRSVS